MLGKVINSDSVFGIRMSSGMFGYEVLEPIGEGAHSRIHRVRQPGSDSVYALKHVVLKEPKDARFFQQLENEFHIGKQVHGVGLRRSLHLHAYRSVLGTPVEAGLLLEYAEGMRLDKAGLGIEAIVGCFARVARALHGLHMTHIVHCDLKPGNILVQANGFATIIDLGQACPFGTVKPRIQGTPDFIAPEQVHCRPVSALTDVFGIGACIYWALTHRALPTLFTLKREKNSFLLDNTFPEPRAINARVPQVLSDLVMECVKTNPSKRPASAMEVSQRLEAIAYALQRVRARQNGQHEARHHH